MDNYGLCKYKLEERNLRSNEKQCLHSSSCAKVRFSQTSRTTGEAPSQYWERFGVLNVSWNNVLEVSAPLKEVSRTAFQSILCAFTPTFLFGLVFSRYYPDINSRCIKWPGANGVLLISALQCAIIYTYKVYGFIYWFIDYRIGSYWTTKLVRR